MTDLREAAGEYAALQDAIDRHPSAPSAGGNGLGGNTSATALGAVVATMKIARLYVEDPRPFWLVGAGLLGLLVLGIAFGVKGLRAT